MASARSELTRLRDALSDAIGERVNGISSEEEPTQEALGHLLGEIQAAREVTRALVAASLEGHRNQLQRDRLQSALAGLDEDQRARAEERLADLQQRFERLARRRTDLTANLSALTDRLVG